MDHNSQTLGSTPNLLVNIITELFKKLGVAVVQREAKLYHPMLKKPLETV